LTDRCDGRAPSPPPKKKEKILVGKISGERRPKGRGWIGENEGIFNMVVGWGEEGGCDFI